MEYLPATNEETGKLVFNPSGCGVNPVPRRRVSVAEVGIGPSFVVILDCGPAREASSSALFSPHRQRPVRGHPPDLGSIFVGNAVASNSVCRSFSTEGSKRSTEKVLLGKVPLGLLARQVDVLANQRRPRESEGQTLRVDSSIRKRITVA
jgi:hypothetical protein